MNKINWIRSLSDDGSKSGFRAWTVFSPSSNASFTFSERENRNAMEQSHQLRLILQKYEDDLWVIKSEI